MLNTVKKILATHKNYLLLAAVVLFVISLLLQQNQLTSFNEKQVHQNVEQYIKQQETDFENLCLNNNFIEDLKKSNSAINKAYGIALYEWTDESYELMAWNNLNFIDTIATHYGKDTNYLINNSLGYFDCMLRHIHTNNTSYLAYAILPIQYHFSTTALYKSPIKEYFNYYNIDTANKSNIAIHTSNNNLLFYLSKNQAVFNVPYNFITIATRLLAIILLCFYIHLLAIAIVTHKGFKKGFLFLLLILGLLRSITYFFKVPFIFSKLSLFDPTIFASNILHPSLGDLLINLLLLFWIVSFTENKKISTTQSLNSKWQAILQLGIIAGITFLFIDVIKSLVIDSKIPFDVENFFNLNEFTAVAFVAICIIIINYVKISIALYKAVMQHKIPLYLQLLIVTAIGIAGILFEKYFTKYQTTFTIIILSWIIIFVCLLFLLEYKRLFFYQKNRIISLYWILFFTASAAGLIVFFEEKLELEQRKQLAEKIYLSKESNESFSLSESQSSEYSYAIYYYGKLKEKNGINFFYRHQSLYNIGFNIEEDNDESKLTYQATKDIAVVIIKHTKHTLNFLTLFAYLFFAIILVVFALFIILKIASSHKFWSGIKEKIYSIDVQIKTTILLLSAASFITVGFVSIYFYNKKFNIANDDKILKALSNINQVSALISLEDTSLHDIITDAEIKNNLVIDIYDIDGKLIEKSNKLGKKGNYILQQMNFTAYQTIYLQHELYFKQQEENYGEKYYSFYKPLLNNSGQTIGCINIPDINYKKSLRQDLSGFIATLINIISFIFLLAAAIAFIVTNRITSSFTLIKNKMKAINWQSQNDEIEWTRNDEIGALVKEYNLMVRKLDETAKAFAQNQKEMAWKEMAKQVAHEIKNPLTPMKLSIQYLQNKIGEDAPNIKQLSATVANTLIEQINQLSNIASDFSQFANIGNTKAEKIELTDIVSNVVNLFSAHENVSIEYNNDGLTQFVFADKTQMIRLFTNLIKNAIEASIENKHTHIVIEQKIVNHRITILLKDNGTGISEDLQPKIFTINFTTKNSGTGLGLAICKGIVENANGNIWFETGNNGTIFFVELPLI